MAIFEIEGPDGTIYEVDAPDEQSAVSGFQQMMGVNTRVDPQTNQPAGVPEYVPPGVEGYDAQTGEVTRQPRSMAASAMHGAIDINGYGFADELASYAGSAITGRPRDEVLGEMRDLQKQAQQDNPGSYLAGQVAGGIAQSVGLVGAGLSPTVHAVNAGYRLPLIAAASGTEGATHGAIRGAGAGTTPEERWDGAKSGAAWGFGLGAISPYAIAGLSKIAEKAITPFRTAPERVAAAATLADEGVPVTAGQLTGNRSLRFSESEIGGAKAAAVMDQQKDAFTSAVLRRAGINANRATPEVIDNAFTTVGQRFDDLAASNQVIPDTKMIQDLRSVFTQYGDTVAESQRAPIVEKLTNDIVKASQRGPISGEAYQNLTSRIARTARGASTPDLKQTLYGIREALDDAMERSIARTNPKDFNGWRQAREQYRNLLAIEQAATRAGEAAAEGIITPANIRNAIVNQGRRAYARGKGDFADLARSGSMLLSPLPDSGTAGRLRAQNLAAFGPMVGGAVVGGGAGAYQTGDYTGALIGAGIGAAAPRLAGRALMSQPVQRYLSNQAMTQPMSPMLQGLLGGVAAQEAGRLAPRLASP
jgi:hypothetical protein